MPRSWSRALAIRTFADDCLLDPSCKAVTAVGLRGSLASHKARSTQMERVRSALGKRIMGLQGGENGFAIFRIAV